MLSPDQIDDIYNFIQKRFEKSGELPLRETLKTVFCPDVSKYKDKVLIRMSCNFNRGGDWCENKLIDRKYWDLIQDYPDYESTEMYLGEVNGKHSEVIREFDDIFDEVVDDPYEIYDIAQHHYISDLYGDPPEEDDDFLRNFKDVFNSEKYKDKHLYTFFYKDIYKNVLVSKSFDIKLGNEYIDYMFDGMDGLEMAGLEGETGDPKEISEYIYEYGEPEDESFFNNDFNYYEFFSK